MEALEDRCLLSIAASSAAAPVVHVLDASQATPFFLPVQALPADAAMAQAAPVPSVLATAYTPFEIAMPALKDWLRWAPLEFTTAASNAPLLALPKPDGTVERFRVVEAPVMAPELAAQCPDIKTFRGAGVDDPTAGVRFDYTPLGFHAQVLSVSGSYYIDPYYLNDAAGTYVSFYKRDIVGAEAWQCEDSSAQMADPALEAKLDAVFDDALSGPSLAPSLSYGDTLRTFRAAVAADGEYVAAVGGGTVTGGRAAVVTAMNRVTGVYETELDVRMVLVANENSIIYTNANTDPYTNDNPSALLGQNQTNLDAVIGNANYDIGHVFTTGGGGLAYLGVVGVTGWKARG